MRSSAIVRKWRPREVFNVDFAIYFSPPSSKRLITYIMLIICSHREVSSLIRVLQLVENGNMVLTIVPVSRLCAPHGFHVSPACADDRTSEPPSSQQETKEAAAKGADVWKHEATCRLIAACKPTVDKGGAIPKSFWNEYAE